VNEFFQSARPEASASLEQNYDSQNISTNGTAFFPPVAVARPL